MNYSNARRTASKKIKKNGATLGQRVGEEWIDSVTGGVVDEPVYYPSKGEVNPETGNPVIRQTKISSFKGIEYKSKMVFGDFAPDSNYLGALIAEDEVAFIVDAYVELSLGQEILVCGEPRNVTKIERVMPGDEEIFKMIAVKR